MYICIHTCTHYAAAPLLPRCMAHFDNACGSGAELENLDGLMGRAKARPKS